MISAWERRSRIALHTRCALLLDSHRLFDVQGLTQLVLFALHGLHWIPITEEKLADGESGLLSSRKKMLQSLECQCQCVLKENSSSDAC